MYHAHSTNDFSSDHSHTYDPAPTRAFRLAAIAALAVGVASFAIGLVNADMLLNEKGYYLATLLLGLFAAVSVQKSVRDRLEGIQTSQIYYLLSWAATGSAIVLLCLGLYNADLMLSEKGFFGIAYLLCLFASVTVQKNIRDVLASENMLAAQHHAKIRAKDQLSFDGHNEALTRLKQAAEQKQSSKAKLHKDTNIATSEALSSEADQT